MKLQLYIVLAAAILASGCISASSTTHVSEEAEIDKEVIEVSMYKPVYSAFSQFEDPFNEIRELDSKSLKHFRVGDHQVENISGVLRQKARVILHGVGPRENSSLKLYRQNGEVILNDSEQLLASYSLSGSDETEGTPDKESKKMIDEGLEVVKKIEMPGTILETTGDKINSQTVRYGTEEILNGKEIYVRSSTGG